MWATDKAFTFIHSISGVAVDLHLEGNEQTIKPVGTYKVGMQQNTVGCPLWK